MTEGRPAGRRAIVLRRSDYNGTELERIVRANTLEIVYTVVTDTGPRLGVLIAVQHVLEHGTEVIVVPHLTLEEVRRERTWHTLTALADLVTASGVVPRGAYAVPRPDRGSG
ncbi:hypothetical protein HGA13_18400 [Nocardia speluncae]|uniref:Uncharacterized protein n=1 Tax=Nocardia speluncae TaxID=419477 RepID=A0A846XFZ0_9NOCA|nr:hypothetical protein [Nocardia speluncae]NKY35028.1 hypothetical protein [Nocardia speluncae]